MSYAEKGYATEATDYQSARSVPSVQAPPPAISVAGRALEEARELAYRVNIIVDRFCGPVPKAVDGSAGKEGPSQSILDGLKGDAERTIRALRDASDELNRLEREIP